MRKGDEYVGRKWGGKAEQRLTCLLMGLMLWGTPALVQGAGRAPDGRRSGPAAEAAGQDRLRRAVESLLSEWAAELGSGVAARLRGGGSRGLIGDSGEFRSADGRGNNLLHPEWGSAQKAYLRLISPDYADGRELPAGADRPSAREISNAVAAQEGSIANPLRASDFLWQWGQFLDHDLSLTATIDPPEPFDIPVPSGDPSFDPFGAGDRVIPMDRSFYEVVDGIRQQVNEITAFIDASNVYGSDPARARELRSLDGTGKLKTSPGEFLPFNANGFPNAPDSSDPSFFIAGDFRANEQVALTALHTLFVREHNFWAEFLNLVFPALSGEEVYQLARAVVGAEMQVITYQEFLPVLLGPHPLEPYSGYHPEVNPGISNVFASAAYRFGHSMLSSVILRLDESGRPIASGNLRLLDAFFTPAELVENGGIEPLLRGLAAQTAQDIDNRVVDDVRNLLFGPPGAGGSDLASLNIQRGRDHGLPGYNRARTLLNLVPADSFEAVHPDPAVQQRLAAVYGSVDEIDLWVGGLVEPHLPGALVGETFFVILQDQFRRLRDGDRFWYLLRPDLAELVGQQTLASVIRRNTAIGREIQENVFLTPLPAQEKLYFAQLANGPGVTTEIRLTNPSETESATGEVRFFDNGGLPVLIGVAASKPGGTAPLALETSPAEAASQVTFTVGPLESISISTDGKGELVSCSAAVSADLPLTGLIQFSLPGLEATATEPGMPAPQVMAPVRRSAAGGVNTGIALYNASEGPVTLNLVLRDPDRRALSNGTRSIPEFPAAGHLAQFLDQLFPDADTGDFQGTLTVEAPGGAVVATVLEVGPDSGQMIPVRVMPLN